MARNLLPDGNCVPSVYRKAIGAETESATPFIKRELRSFKNGGPNNAFTEQNMIWDKFNIYHQVKSYETVFGIGERLDYSIEKKVFRNPLKQALWYQEQIGKEFIGTQKELGRKIGVSRSRIANVLRLVGLEEEIKEFILGIGENDERIKLIKEHKLGPLLDLVREDQLGKFWEMVEKGKGERALR